jgi:hypothetical protein
MGAATPAIAAAPTNDDITGAVAISAVPYTTTTDTNEATVGLEDSSCGAATVWYVFTPPTDGSYDLTTIGSDYDTTLAVWEGEPGNLTYLACSDDAFGVQSALRLDLTAGTTYYLEAGTCCGGEVGQIGPGGSLTVNVSAAGPVFQISGFTIDRATLTAEPSVVVLHGTITCSANGGVDISGTLRQRQGLNIVLSGFYASTTCSTSPTTWTATADAVNRVWLTKQATVSASLYGCDIYSCDDHQITAQTMRIRRR